MFSAGRFSCEWKVGRTWATWTYGRSSGWQQSKMIFYWHGRPLRPWTASDSPNESYSPIAPGHSLVSKDFPFDMSMPCSWHGTRPASNTKHPLETQTSQKSGCSKIRSPSRARLYSGRAYGQFWGAVSIDVSHFMVSVLNSSSGTI